MTENSIKEILYKMITKGFQEKTLSINQLINKYLENCSFKCRPDTISFYKKELEIINKFFLNNGINNCNEITLETIQRFIFLEKEKKKKNNTINKIVGTLKQALTYAERINLIDSNPIRNWQKLPKEKSQIKNIDLYYVNLIFEHLKTLDLNKPSNLRLSLTLHLYLDTGVRRNELRHIKVKNINLDENSIFLDFTKTRDTAFVYFTNATKILLIKYLNLFQPNDYLIVDYISKKQIPNANFYEQLKKIKKDLSIPNEVSISPHKWRHTLATLLLNETNNLEIVRSYLRHSNYNTTMLYVHTSNEQKKDKILESKMINSIYGN